MKIFEMIMRVLPDVLSLADFFINMGDKEFEDISKTWPAPIKTTLAKLRFEAKLAEKFPTEVDRD